MAASALEGTPGSSNAVSRESSASPARDPCHSASLPGAALPEVYEAQIRKMAVALERADQEKARLEGELPGVVYDMGQGI